MKIIVLGDLHFIAPDDPCIDRHQSRMHFMKAAPSFDRIIKLVTKEAPDLIISLGDVVDWYSAENVNFGIERLNELHTPWIMTPGNHDLAGYTPPRSNFALSVPIDQEKHTPIAVKGWGNRNIIIGNQTIDAGRYQLLLMNSALNTIPESTETWLDNTLTQSNNILFTHVPLYHPEIASYIHQVDPKRNLEKYMQSDYPLLWEEHLKGRLRAVFSAHLHFPGRLDVSGTTCYLCPLSILPVQRQYPGQGSITVLTLKNDDISVRTLSIE